MKYLIAIIAIAIIVIIYSGTGSLWYNQYDDSYIAYRYAVNLAEGKGLVFNEGEKADAASSFLFTVMLAGFYRIGIHDLELVSCLLNLLAVGLIAAIVYLSALRLSGNKIGAMAFGLITSLHGFISGWAALGMDTVFFAALMVMWSYWTFIEQRETVSVVLTVLVALTRFEGILAIPFWFIATKPGRKRTAVILGLLTIYYAVRYQYYGTFLPHSYYAKEFMVYYHAQPLNIIYTWGQFALAIPFLAFTGALMDHRVRWLGLYILISGASCLAGPNSDWCRYTVHLLPLMLIAGAPTIRQWYVAAILCAFMIWQGYGSVQWMRNNAKSLAPCQVIRGEIGGWLTKNINGAQWIVSSDIGEIGYHAKDRRFIDLNGLISVDVLEAKRAGSGVDSILTAKKPVYIADTFGIENETLNYNHQEIAKYIEKFDTKFIIGEKFKYNLLIGDATAEELKINIGSAYLPKKSENKEKLAVVRGRDIESGLPRTLKVSETEVREALTPTLLNISSGRLRREEVPPVMMMP